jgi:transposase-like protein
VDTQIRENARKECSTDNPTKTAKRRDRRSFSSEFKAEAVRMCKAGDRSIERVTKDLDQTKTALRHWV